jgi:sarcosine oxidase subunit beta
MPHSVDIAVIGAGITGLAIALELVERSAGRVAVYERSGVAAGASGVAPGGVRQQWGTSVNCRMAREGLDFYREANERLAPQAPLVFRSCGYVFVAHSAHALEQLKANAELQRRLGIPARTLDRQEVEEIVPMIDAGTVAGGTYCAEDGYFDNPRDVVAAFAVAARRRGAGIDIADVAALTREGSGWSLRLADGRAALAAAVVIAAGADSPTLLAPLRVELPIRKEARYLFYSDPLHERWLDPLVISPERAFAAKQMSSARLLVSDLAAVRSPGGDLESDRKAWLARIRQVAGELLPRVSEVPLTHLVEGVYDSTPDGQAILGPVAGQSGLWLAAGFSGRGFMVAPAVARATASAILGDDPGDDYRALELGRFERGDLLPEPQIV